MPQPPQHLWATVPSLRVRHVIKNDVRYVLLFNESGQRLSTELNVDASSTAAWVDTATGKVDRVVMPARLDLPDFGFRLLQVK